MMRRMDAIFEKAVVIGSNKTAAVCAEILIRGGIKTEFFTVEGTQGVISQKVLAATARGHIMPNRVVRKEFLTEFLMEEQKNVLLVSAANRWLIPTEILAKKNLTAVNFHNSLLPRHPGRNAEAWCIFEQDTVSGITWHFIEPKIDAGDIIIQKEILLDEDITSFLLLRKQNEMAVEAFRLFLPELLCGRCSRTKQEGTRGKLHYSWERPNGGILDLNWKADKISSFLRAMDYGLLKELGDPECIINGETYTWKKYIVSDYPVGAAEETIIRQNEICIRKDGREICLKGMGMIEP